MDATRKSAEMQRDAESRLLDKKSAPEAPNKESALRLDPASRPADGAFNGTRLRVRDADPTRHYVAVDKRAGMIDQYLEMGYEMELRRVGGPHFAYANSSDGGHVEGMGCVLMSIAKAAMEVNERDGAELWGLGSKHFDRMDEAILRQDGIVDPLRNQHNRMYHQVTGTGLRNG